MSARGRAASLVLLLATLLADASHAAENPTSAATPLERLQRYLAIDTSNPPGQEIRGARYLADLLAAARIESEVIESAPGRAAVYARLKGTGREPALLLLHHIDVVPVTRSTWTVDPFAGEVRDGFLYGRGAFDIKSLGIMQLEAFVALARSKRRPMRDVVYLATPDEEEGGGKGVGWLLEHRPDVFEGVGFVLNEGGFGVEGDGGTSFRIELAQKRPLWLRLTATDAGGHASMPRPTSATNRLIAALERVRSLPFTPRVLPEVRRMFAVLARRAGLEWAAVLADIDRAVQDPATLARLQANKPDLHALVRNTCSLTRLSGSAKINVVPSSASAELDCRLLPDEDAAAFIESIRRAVDDPNIQVEQLLLFADGRSPADTELYRVLAQVTHRHYPDALVVPAVSFGFTDSHYLRERGIVCYGFNPMVLLEADLGRVHGDDERIRLVSFERGIHVLIDVLARFASH